MRIKAKDLFVGQVFRMVDCPVEYVCVGLTSLGVYYKPCNYKLGHSSKFMSGYYFIDVLPYESDYQLSLFP